MAKLHTIIIVSTCDPDDIKNKKIIINDDTPEKTIIGIRESIETMSEDYSNEPEHQNFVDNVLRNIKEIKVDIQEDIDIYSEDEFSHTFGHSTIDTPFSTFIYTTEIIINDKKDSMDRDKLELLAEEMLEHYIKIGSESDIIIESKVLEVTKKNTLK